MKYVIGTRGSELALAQANYVRGRLAETYTEDEFEIRIIKTTGDLMLDKPLHEIGDKGVFVREIEEQLLSGKIQIGVHSMKDMPAFPANGLLFTKAWKREDPRDVLVLREKKSLEELPEGAVIGTGSRRREIQLKKLRPDIDVVGIRGNVQTRIRKMEEQKLDGIVLAAAGLHRLGMKEKITCYLEPEEMIPAPAQGILALEIREGGERLLEMLDALCDTDTVREAEAERGFLQEIGGSCHIPVGAVCRKDKEAGFRLDVMFGNKSGTKDAAVSVWGTDTKEMAKQAAAMIRQKLAGTVFLVGAGPGDPGLITVKGLSVLREADCMIYDRLASPELLKEAKAGCELIYAGKENHNHTMPQEEINRLLVQKSMEHKTVVRLKGGDAYVFGRGGEEGLFLRECGVPFEIVPGISSAIAGPAYAGIPVTHRGVSLGFHVVTAHDKEDSLSDLDFEAMARGKETCVFLMGLSKAGEIAKELLAAGMPGDTKAAVIAHAATPRQKTCVSDLLHLEKDVAAAGLSSPAVIVVGGVVSLREGLNVFENRPLFGKRYLIPKIGEGSARLGELLKSRGADVVELQAGTILNKKVKFTAKQMRDADWLVFTSRNGVTAFFENFLDSGLDARNLAGCQIAAIGEKTEEALKAYGLHADFIPENFNSGVFAEEFGKTLSDRKRKVLYFKAENADSHLKKALEGICDFEEIAVYENCAVEINAKKIGSYEAYDGVLFTCASSAKRLMKAAGKAFGRCKIYSIGPKTTECLKRCGIETVTEAARSTYEGLVECVMQEKTVTAKK